MKRIMKAKLMRKLPTLEDSGSSVGLEGRRLGSVEDRMEDKRLLLSILCCASWSWMESVEDKICVKIDCVES